MKNKKVFNLSVILISSIFLISSLLFINSNDKLVKALENNYSLSFDSSFPSFINKENKEVTLDVKTRSDNELKFTTNGNKEGNNFLTLDKDQYFFNPYLKDAKYKNAIDGLKDLTITFTGSLIIEYGYKDLINDNVKYTVFNQSISSENPYTFNNLGPSYFKIKALDKTSITHISINYSCNERVNPFADKNEFETMVTVMPLLPDPFGVITKILHPSKMMILPSYYYCDNVNDQESYNKIFEIASVASNAITKPIENATYYVPITYSYLFYDFTPAYKSAVLYCEGAWNTMSSEMSNSLSNFKNYYYNSTISEVKENEFYIYQNAFDGILVHKAKNTLKGSVYLPNKIDNKKVLFYQDGCFKDNRLLKELYAKDGQYIFGRRAFGNNMFTVLLDENTTKNKDNFDLDFETGFNGTVVYNSTFEIIFDGNTKYAVMNNNNVKELVLLSGDDTSTSDIISHMKVVEIGNVAFSGALETTSFICPKYVRKIGRYAFSLTPLNSFTFPDTLEVISSYAFNGSLLEEVKLPYSVKVIEEQAFSDCYDLTNVYLNSNILEIGDHAFSCLNPSAKIYIYNKNNEKTHTWSNIDYTDISEQNIIYTNVSYL